MEASVGGFAQKQGTSKVTRFVYDKSEGSLLFWRSPGIMTPCLTASFVIMIITVVLLYQVYYYNHNYIIIIIIIIIIIVIIITIIYFTLEQCIVCTCSSPT